MKKIYLSLFATILSVYAMAQLPQRNNEPKVFTGDVFFTYLGHPISSIVAFKRANNNWVQVPVQIDERVDKDIVSGYGALANGTPFPPSANNPKILFYSDTATHIGADNDTMFDSNDELVLMLKDAGEKYTVGATPTGIVFGTGKEITLTDNFTGDVGYIYLFRHNGSLQQSAGISYVNYLSNVKTVAGWPAHINGLNNENTTISTSSYSWHISAEWKSDELKIALGNNADILDRHKNFFANGTCARSENTFSDAENAYLTCKAGPIRVIRSVMGANSGPLTQRTHIFYQGRIDIATDLRVHAIPSVYDVIDYSPAANGMVYTNNLNSTSATIDGLGNTDDLSTTGVLRWEQVKGVQGTVSWLHIKDTDMFPPDDNVTFGAYYNDSSANPASNCTGDGQAWGTSGWGAVFGGSYSTDPIGDAGAANLRALSAKRIAYIDAPTASDTAAMHYNETEYMSPVIAIVQPLVENLPLTASVNTTPALCAGGEAFSEIIVTGSTGDVTYHWSQDESLESSGALLYAGNYSVTVKDDVDSLVFNITITGPAPLDTSVNLSVNELTATSNMVNVEYQWINCATMLPIQNEIGQSFSSITAGSFAVILTDPNGCMDTSNCVNLAGEPLGIDGLNIAEVNLYPNPSQGHVMLDVANSKADSYEVVDIYGRLIANAAITNTITQIPTQLYAQGIYVVKVKAEGRELKSILLVRE